MSIKRGNDLFRKGMYEQAITEYKKINKENTVFESAQFNIKLANFHQKKTESSDLRTVTDIDLKSISDAEPLLSIIMPVYNVAPYLEASILSVIGQSYKNFELIIIDDASTDNSAKIIDFFSKQDNRIKYIQLDHNSLGGAGIPSNIGIRYATGVYIGFVDSDDIVHKHAFRDLIATAEKHKAEIVIGDFSRFDQNYHADQKGYDKNHWNDIPLNVTFDPVRFSKIFRLSPVPWRKLYRCDFLKTNHIAFAEGDFFYEDNPLHWLVLLHAKKVVVIDQITSFHRMGREGQTMGASDWKFAAVFMHINSTRKFLKNFPQANRIHWTELLDQIYRSDWIYKNTKDIILKNLLRKLSAITCKLILADSKILSEEMDKFRPEFSRRYTENNASRSDMDLTIIIPVFQAATFLDDLFRSLEEIKTIKYDVIFIDDGSTDDSLKKCQDFCQKSKLNFAFTQKNKGGGRARNAAIPLASGRYTYFFDADDVLIPHVLEQAVINATANDNDLYFMPYKLLRCTAKEERISDMFAADTRLWTALKNQRDTSSYGEIIVGMINYPWNRIIKTAMLHENGIFFGGTPVHNDILYHWHSICSARSIGYGNEVVCHHRLFKERDQITNISDRRRLHIFTALEDTYAVVMKMTSFKKYFNAWEKFSLELMNWAENVIQESLRDEFLNRKKKSLEIIL